VAVVEFDTFHVFVYLGMVLQHHHVTGHECLIQLVSDLHRLFRCVLVRFGYYAKHVLFVEVEIPDVCEYGSELSYAIQL